MRNGSISLSFALFLIVAPRIGDLFVIVKETAIDGKFIGMRISPEEIVDWDE